MTTTEITYLPRKGSGISSEEAEKRGRELDRVSREYGELTPRTLVDSQRDLEAPLHSSFEWDDHTAAEGYRRQQARRIIRSIVVEEPKTGEPVAKYVSIEEQKVTVAGAPIDEDNEPKSKYVDVERVRDSASMRRQAIESLIKRTCQHRDEMAQFDELEGMVAALDRERTKLQKRGFEV